jgi:hypothetical protein
MPYPENLDRHFVADPTKFDFYAMDCYSMLADDKLAENLANEVIQRNSLPSLLMVSRDLTRVLNQRYPTESGTRQYLDQLHTLSEASKLPV